MLVVCYRSFSSPIMPLDAPARAAPTLRPIAYRPTSRCIYGHIIMPACRSSALRKPAHWWNDRIVNQPVKMAAHIGIDLGREIIARIKHGQNNALNVEPRVQAAPTCSIALAIGWPFQRKKLALQGHQTTVQQPLHSVPHVQAGGQSMKIYE